MGCVIIGWGGFGGLGAVPSSSPFQVIGHCLICLLVATLGGVLATVCFPVRSGTSDPPEAERRTDPSAPRRVRRRVAVAVTLATLVGSALAVVALRTGSEFWAGATFLLTCGLMGLAILGAVWGRGKGRAVWLGAALFGAGYLVLVLGRYPDPDVWPHLSADQFVEALYERLPHVSRNLSIPPDGISGGNARVRSLLEKPIPMNFPNETPLVEVLNYIQRATKEPNDTGLPIYVDPIGLQEAEKTPNSPVTIGVEGVPLKTTLRLLLSQLGLDYRVRRGVLVISDTQSGKWPSDDEPALLVGHCLLAVLASVLGGVASGFLYAWRGRSVEQPAVA